MNDQYEGQGGSYVINAAGERELVSRTLAPGEAPPESPAAPEPPTLTEVITPTEPANAGFFTPVAPADDHPTTTE